MKTEELAKIVYLREDGQRLEKKVDNLEGRFDVFQTSVDNMAFDLKDVKEELKVLTRGTVARMQSEIDKLKT